MTSVHEASFLRVSISMRSGRAGGGALRACGVSGERMDNGPERARLRIQFTGSDVPNYRYMVRCTVAYTTIYVLAEKPIVDPKRMGMHDLRTQIAKVHESRDAASRRSSIMRG